MVRYPLGKARNGADDGNAQARGGEATQRRRQGAPMSAQRGLVVVIREGGNPPSNHDSGKWLGVGAVSGQLIADRGGHCDQSGCANPSLHPNPSAL